jgi:hypothetical protein
MSAADPQSFNRYSYVRNSSLNRVDPSGMFDATDEVRSTRWVMSQSFGVAGEGGKESHVHDFDWAEALNNIALHEEISVSVEPAVNDAANEAVAEFWAAWDPNGLDPENPFAVYPQKRILTFDQLWENHPGVQNSDAVVTLCAQYPGENCAIDCQSHCSGLAWICHLSKERRAIQPRVDRRQ